MTDVDVETLLRGLVEMFGADRVAAEPEDLYVYSRLGEFGVREMPPPVAVLRLESSEAAAVAGVVGDSGAGLVYVDEGGARRVDGAYLLVDGRQPISLSDLEERIAENAREDEDRRRRVRGLRALARHASAYFQSRDGYRLRDRMGDGSGFCVVQRHLGGLETFSAKGRLLLSRGLSRGEVEVSPRLVDSIYNCTACGQCYDQLMGTLEINNAIVKTRNVIAERGAAPPRCRRLLRNLEAEGNPMGMPREDRALWYMDAAEEFRYRGGGVLYWPGCTTSYRLPEVVEATARILDEAGVGFGLLGEAEGCCGLIMYLLGYWGEAARNASEVVAGLGSPEAVVTSCAGCYYAFKRVYPHLGVTPPRVLHTSQLFSRLVREERLAFKEAKGRVTWHDPCDLGRHCGVYEPPREVLRAVPGLSLVEPGLTREHAVCCGAGGGLWMYNEGLTDMVSRQKVEEALPSGVDGVVTGCPTCLLNLRGAAGEARPGLGVHDLSEFLVRCM